MSREKVLKTKMHHSFGDNMLAVVCYIIFALCALICIYPFYYIFINTISANAVSYTHLDVYKRQDQWR